MAVTSVTSPKRKGKRPRAAPQGPHSSQVLPGTFHGWSEGLRWPPHTEHGTSCSRGLSWGDMVQQHTKIHQADGIKSLLVQGWDGRSWPGWGHTRLRPQPPLLPPRHPT